jgi:hypothetical protein
MRRWKQPASTIWRHDQRFTRSLPVDPLKLEPPFQLPAPGPPLSESRKPRRAKSKHPAPRAPKDRSLAKRRKMKFWERLKIHAYFMFAAIPDSRSMMSRAIECEPVIQAMTKTEMTSGTIAQSDGISTEMTAPNPYPTDISMYKAKINRALGAGKWHGSDYRKLLRQSVSQDATIQKVLPLVMAAATDITVGEQEGKDAAESIIDFTITSLDDYRVVSASCDDKTDRLTYALAEIVLFYGGVDEELSQRACSVLSHVAEIDRLEAKLEKKKDEMRELAKTQNTAIKATLLGSLSAAPIIEILAPGVVERIWPIYLAYLAVLGVAGWRLKSSISMRNLSEQRELEASQEEVKEELLDMVPLNLLTEQKI